MPTYQTIPINIAGPSYPERSRPLSSQESRNFYHELVKSIGNKLVVKSFPGLRFLGSGAAGVDRGSHQMSEVCYRVIGTTLYSVALSGTHTSLGTIPGTERCIFADDGVNLFVVADAQVTQYDSSTATVSTVTDTNIVGALSVAFINSQFLYTFPQLTVLSNAGDGSTASGLNAINEESNGDDLVRDYVFDQTIYRFGKRTCPNWYNTDTGTPPLARIEGQIINIGLKAKWSVANTSEYLYFLGSDSNIYQARGGNKTSVTPAAIAGEFQKYALAGQADNAFAYTFTIDNKEMYMITFPDADKTWCLIEELGQDGWFQLASGVNDAPKKYDINSVCVVYDRVLMGDSDSGYLYYLDFEKYDLNGATWLRRRVLSSINGELIGAPGKRIQMNRFELIMEKGIGLISGQGSNPKIMVEASYDGGKSWDAGTWMKIGRLGEFTLKAEWHNTKAFYDLIIRLSISDPVAITIFSGTIDLKLAGW